MMLLLKKRLSYFLAYGSTAGGSTTLNSWFHALLPKCSLVYSTTQDSLAKPHFMVEYLINSLGFSPDKATKASKYLTRLKSTEKPDSVVRFLRDQGFSKAHITAIIAGCPSVLCASLEKTLQPNMKALVGMGLPRPLLTQLVVSNPPALELRAAVSRIEFWRSFFGGDDKKLLRAFKRTRGLVSHGINSSIAPKISFLGKLGFSEDSIRKMVSLIPQFITNTLGKMEAQVKHTEQLGFTRDSGMFVYGLFAVANVRKETLEKKMELLRSFGWSEQDLFSAVLKAPHIIIISENNIRTKMDFLVGEVGVEPSYISSHPTLMTLSLEKRLFPRYSVIQVLKSKDLTCVRGGIFSVMTLSEKKFIERYILPHQHAIPELNNAYIAACDGKVPTLFSHTID